MGLWHKCVISRWRAARPAALHLERVLMWRFQRRARPVGMTNARHANRQRRDAALWIGVVSSAGLGVMSTVAVRRCVPQRSIAGGAHELARAAVPIREQACAPARKVGETAAAGASSRIVGAGVVKILAIGGFDECRHGVGLEPGSADTQRSVLRARAPAKGQSPKRKSRLSAVQPAMLHRAARTNSARIANAITTITASPPSGVASTRSLADLNHAVEIPSLLGLRPVRQCGSRLPTTGNGGSPSRSDDIPPYEREKAGDK